MNFLTSVCQCIMEAENILVKYLRNALVLPFQVCFGIQVFSSTVIESHPANKFENCFFLQNLNFYLSANVLSALFQLATHVFQCCLWFWNLLSIFLQFRPKLIN